MNDVEVTRRLDDADRLDVQALLARIADKNGFWPLSDQLAADLDRPDPADELRPISVLMRSPADGTLAGYAQASHREGGWTMQTATVQGAEGIARTGRLVAALLAEIDRTGGEVDWWVAQPAAGIDDVAATHGFAVDRDLLQMRRDLPAERRSNVVTRSFVVGADEEVWLPVNNRAFAGHAEQGGWSIETLRQRISQPWFDAAGFRLHERDGRLAAFCWTKIHGERDEQVGEIYVIGVDPDFQGLGLGKELTFSGLDHMVDVGAMQAMLYVDGDNDAAKALYHRLGFAVHRTDRAFRRASTEASR